jgi:hypothetical protein
MNILFLCYAIFHMLILIIVFRNGWIFFLLPFVLTIFATINILFSFGMFVEIISRKFNSKINFDKIAPEIKFWQYIANFILVAVLSVMHILSQE